MEDARTNAELSFLPEKAVGEQQPQEKLEHPRHNFDEHLDVEGDYDEHEDIRDEDGDEDADSLPPWANAANVELNAVVTKREALVEKKSAELDDNKERVVIMKEHLKNVEQEILNTQALLDSKAKAIETEEHLKRLSERELSQLRLDSEKAKLKERELQERSNATQNEIFLTNEKLEKFRLQMNWNQEELEQWALASKQKEEDNDALERYKRSDDARVKALSLRIETLTTNSQRLQLDLDKEVTETHTVQIELDKTADDFKALHLERQEVVRQWEEAQKAIVARDEDVTRVAEQVAQLKKVKEEKMKALDEQKHFLEREKNNNSQAELSIEAAERSVEKARFRLNSESSAVREMENESDMLRRELNEAESELRRSKGALRAVKDEQERVLKRHDEAESRLAATKERMEGEFRKSDDLEERSRQVHTLYREQKEQLDVARREQEQLTQFMFRQSQELFNARKEESNLIAEISGEQASLRNIQSKIEDLDSKSLTQQETLYNVEFQVQQMERKLARASGKRTFDETIELNKKIAELQKQLDEANKQYDMLSTQVKKVSDEQTKCHRELVATKEANVAASNKLKEIELENDSAELELKTFVRAKENLIVQHDELKLEVKRLETNLRSIIDQVFALENRSQQLRMSVEEREREVSLHRDLKRLEEKACDDARHKVVLEMREREQRVKTLRLKYETVASRRAAGPDDVEHSQAYYIIAAAQERDELQREGDALNSKLKKAAKELHGLEKVMAQLDARNTKYRMSFHKADMSGPEAQQKMMLDEKLKAISDNLFKKKSYLREIASDFEERRRMMHEVEDELAVAQEQVVNKHQRFDNLSLELDELNGKINRATASANALVEQIRKSRNTTDVSIEEKDIEANEKRDKIDLVLRLLAELVAEHNDIAQAIQRALDEAKLILPSQQQQQQQQQDTTAAIDGDL